MEGRRGVGYSGEASATMSTWVRGSFHRSPLLLLSLIHSVLSSEPGQDGLGVWWFGCGLSWWAALLVHALCIDCHLHSLLLALDKQ